MKKVYRIYFEMRIKGKWKEGFVDDEADSEEDAVDQFVDNCSDPNNYRDIHAWLMSE